MTISKNKILTTVSLIAILFLFSGNLIGEENPLITYKQNPLPLPFNQTNADSVNKLEYVPGELIVKFKPYIPEEDVSISSYKEERDGLLKKQLASDFIEALKEKYGVTEIGKVFKESKFIGLEQEETEISKALDKAFPGFEEKFKEGAYNQISKLDLSSIHKFKLSKDTDVLAAAAEFSNDPSVEYAEPNYICHATKVPNDPYYHSSGAWGQDYDDLWGIKKIQCEGAWDISQGEGVVVAVIDTGVDYNPEDIADNIYINKDEIPDNGIDDDNNGYIDDYCGYDFAYGDSEPMDGHGHGTHCAGIIAATGNNNIGVIGVAPKTKIMVVKGLNDIGSGSDDVLANCIRYAADNGAKVLSNSWGSDGSSALIEDAVNYAYSKGCVVVAAAGNANSDVGGFCPANIKNVIAVAATDSNNQKASFSNWGAKIDVAAPGVDILSLRAEGTDIYKDGTHIVGKKYYRASGTSMACPHVSGLVALIIALHPGWTNAQTEAQLINTTDEIDSLNPDYKGMLGTGRINSYKALTMAAQPNIILESHTIDDSQGNGKGELDPGETIKLILTLKNLWLDAADITAVLQCSDPYIKITQDTAGFGDIFQGQSAKNISQPYVLALDKDCSISHQIEFSLIIRDNSNYTKTVKLSFQIHIPFQKGFPVSTQGRIISSPIMDDIDGDGDTEIVSGSDDGSVYAWHHDGQLVSGWPVHTGGQVESSPAIADLNGDGIKEIIIGSGDGKVYVFEPDGSLFPGWPQETGGYVWSSPAIADLDNDGQLDIVAGSLGGKLYVWHNNGVLFDGWPLNFNEINEVIASPALGDINGDGNMEIIIGIGTSLYAFYPDATMVGGAWPVKFTGGFVSSPVLGDIDGDGNLEILAAPCAENLFEATTQMYAFRGNGSLLWSKKTSMGIFSSPALGDIDGDGNLEVVFSTDVNANTYILNARDGSEKINPIKSNSIFSSPALGDIDGDGDQEIITATFYGAIAAWHHDGIMVTGWPIVIPGDMYSSPALGDIDQDGYIEVAIGSGDNKLYVFDLSGSYDTDNISWPMFRHDLRHTGLYTPPMKQDTSYFINKYNLQAVPIIIPPSSWVVGKTAKDLLEMIPECKVVYKWNPASKGSIGYIPQIPRANFNLEPGVGYAISCKKDVVVSFPGTQDPAIPITMYRTSQPIDRYQFTLPSSWLGKKASELAPLLGEIPPCLSYYDTKKQSWIEYMPTVPATDFVLEKGHAYLMQVNKDIMWFPINMLKFPKINHPPILSSIGTKTINENNLLVFNITATDPDGDTLTYSASNLPKGASFNSSTHAFTWTPTYDRAGIYKNIHFEVTDGKLKASEDVAITVTVIIPNAPSGLTATALNTNQINLTWKDNSKNETGFKIERSSGGSFTRIVTTAINTTTYTDNYLTPGTTYYYRVRAYNSAGNSGYSNTASAKTSKINQPPVIKASCFPTSGRCPLNVSFSSNGTYDPDKDRLTYLWEFGDGKSSTNPNSVYKYRKAGTCRAKLTVKDTKGGKSIANFTITVK